MTQLSGLPFDAIRELLSSMPGADTGAAQAVAERDSQLTKPPGSLGKLEDIALWLASWSGRAPQVNRPLVAIFAGNHGVTKRGVSAFPSEVTAQMVQNFANGGAAINQICQAYDLGLKIFDLALEVPTEDFCEKPAMDERTCAATMAYGMEAIAGNVDLLCIGEMGIGNTTSAAAIYYALYGGKAEDWVGAGTGADEAGMARKVEAVEMGVKLHQEHLHDPLEVLRRLGGREIAAMAGAILAGRAQRVPVIVDGFIATAAAAVLFEADPSALDHCLISHVSAEQGHRKVLERMGKEPLLDLNMRLGEGSGAAMAAGIVKAAASCHNGMATFAEAAVSNKDE